MQGEWLPGLPACAIMRAQHRTSLSQPALPPPRRCCACPPRTCPLRTLTSSRRPPLCSLRRWCRRCTRCAARAAWCQHEHRRPGRCLGHWVPAPALPPSFFDTAAPEQAALTWLPCDMALSSRHPAASLPGRIAPPRPVHLYSTHWSVFFPFLPPQRFPLLSLLTSGQSPTMLLTPTPCTLLL